jgi:hypothetical protein
MEHMVIKVLYIVYKPIQKVNVVEEHQEGLLDQINL